MRFKQLEIPDVMLVQSRVIEDERGYFEEAYRKEDFEAAGLPGEFVQDNLSGSRHGTLRGLHYQIRKPQGKILWLLQGETFHVAADLRRSSPTFGRWVGTRLSARGRDRLWVPPGFAHGFYVVGDWAEIFYKTTDYYAPEWERSIRWDDPSLAIEWPVPAGESPLLSGRDRTATFMSDAELYE